MHAGRQPLPWSPRNLRQTPWREPAATSATPVGMPWKKYPTLGNVPPLAWIVETCAANTTGQPAIHTDRACKLRTPSHRSSALHAGPMGHLAPNRRPQFWKQCGICLDHDWATRWEIDEGFLATCHGLGFGKAAWGDPPNATFNAETAPSSGASVDTFLHRRVPDNPVATLRYVRHSGSRQYSVTRPSRYSCSD